MDLFWKKQILYHLPPLLQKNKCQKNQKMKREELTLLAQLVESTDSAAKELESALKERNGEKFKKSKSEILRFQKQIAKILE